FKVFFRQRVHAQRSARNVDTLVRSDSPRQRDLEPRPSRAPPDYLHRHRAVGEQDALANLQVVVKRLDGAGQLMGIVGINRLGGQDKLGAEVTLDDVTGNRSQADLGSAQIL